MAITSIIRIKIIAIKKCIRVLICETWERRFLRKKKIQILLAPPRVRSIVVGSFAKGTNTVCMRLF